MKSERILNRLHELYHHMPIEYCGYVLTAIYDIEKIIHESYNPYEIGKNLYKNGYGISDIWASVLNDNDMIECYKGYEEAHQESMKEAQRITQIEAHR